MNVNIPLVPVVQELEGWAEPRPGLTLDDLVERLRTDGVEVLEIDRPGNRVKILHLTEREGDGF